MASMTGPVKEVVMRKELWIATSLVALLAAPVLAQDATPASPPAAGPAEPVTPSPTAGFVERQDDNEMLTSVIVGTPVVNAADESMGEVNDVLLAADGRLKAVVVGVGGFLGIAERNVAVRWDALDVSWDESRDLVLQLDTGREQLEAAPEFETVADRRATEEAARAADEAARSTQTPVPSTTVPAPTPAPAPTE
jgi:hypothetical protein